jgi:hypothetical protein
MHTVATRKRFLIAAAGASVVWIAMSVAAKADDKVAQSAVQYQDKPNGDKRCAKCQSFVPGASGGDGSCKIVTGTISPNGYCIAFS